MRQAFPMSAGTILAAALLLVTGTIACGEDKTDKAPVAQASQAPAPKPDVDGFYPLFDGKSLDGWKVGKGAENWKVEDGQIVTTSGPSHLFYVGSVCNHDFKNFHAKLEVLTKPSANSGVYFHTEYQEEGWPKKGFECQVNETHRDPKKTGGLYAVNDVLKVQSPADPQKFVWEMTLDGKKVVSDTPPAEDDKWFVYEIIVQDKHVVLKVDGKVTCDWTEPTPPAPPKGMPGRFLSRGTLALQGHDPKSETHYRSILIKPLPE